MVNLPPIPELAQFIKPTLDTPFHVDFEWWTKRGLDLNVELMAHLCHEHRAAYSGQRVSEKIDWIDWETCEVRQVDGLQYIISKHCSHQPDYIQQAPTLLEAIFRVFLSNGNQPLSPRQLAAFVAQMPEQVLRVLSGPEVRKGLRPILRER